MLNNILNWRRFPFLRGCGTFWLLLASVNLGDFDQIIQNNDADVCVERAKQSPIFVHKRLTLNIFYMGKNISHQLTLTRWEIMQQNSSPPF